MRSGTFCFNSTIYRKTMTRFWPIWAINLAFWIIRIPMDGLLTLSSIREDDISRLYYFGRDLGEMARSVGLVFAVIAGLGVAMAVCSHMYNHRAANFMGSLPVRREAQFVSTYTAGFTMLLGPNVVVFLLTFAVEAAGGCVQWPPLLFWLAYLSAAEFFFYSFAVCIGQFTGHMLALPVYYGVFNGIVYGILLLVSMLLETFFFGYTGLGGTWYTVAQLGTPAWIFSTVDLQWDRVESAAGYDAPFAGYTYTGFNLHLLWIYALIALVLAACALLLYRRRHMETAGDAVSVRAMRPVFKYGVAVCAGLAFGFLTSAVLGVESPVSLLVTITLWAVVGCFAAQMFLDKSLKVLKKWKGPAVVAVIFLLFFGAVEVDVFGVVEYVPEVDRVESVTVSGMSGTPWDSGAHAQATLTDPQEIAAVVALHRQVVEFGREGEADPGETYSGTMELELVYTLRSGRSVTRRYYVSAGDVLWGLAQTIRDMESVRRQSYELDVMEELYRLGGLQKVHFRNYGKDGSGAYEFSLEPYKDREMIDALWEAVMADFDGRRLGCVDLANKADKDLPSLEFAFELAVQEGDNGPVRYNYVQFSLPDTATETWELVDEILDWMKEEDPFSEPMLEDIMAGAEG